MAAKCSQCGGDLGPDSPHGLCPRCLLSAAAPAGSNVTVESPFPVGSTPVPEYSGPRPAAIDIGKRAEVARRLPQFEIIDLLGRGGMGVVYKARQVQLDRIVALKILPPGDAMSPGFIERFRREARSLAKLSHANIVNVYDFGETNGLYFLVMEFIDGVTLRELILAHNMTAAEALSLVPKICDALQYAHEEGVVHRDIKPENILIDKKGRVKIADFGLAKLLRRDQSDMTLTQAGAMLGTPRYMAPEQLDKPDSVDHRADIYSLGVVFYEMLTGEIPMGRFALPSEKVRIDVRLDEIVLHALERDVSRRYQHASEVRVDVERVNSSPAIPQPAAGNQAFHAAIPPAGSHPAWQATTAGAAAIAGSPSSPPIAAGPESKDAGTLILLLAMLGATWLGLYVFDQHVQIGDPILLIASHLLIPIVAVIAAAWLFSPRLH